MNPKMKTKDPDIRGSLPAMKRAAKRARELATGTENHAAPGNKERNTA